MKSAFMHLGLCCCIYATLAKTILIVGKLSSKMPSSVSTRFLTCMTECFHRKQWISGGGVNINDDQVRGARTATRLASS